MYLTARTTQSAARAPDEQVELTFCFYLRDGDDWTLDTVLSVSEGNKIRSDNDLRSQPLLKAGTTEAGFLNPSWGRRVKWSLTPPRPGQLGTVGR